MEDNTLVILLAKLINSEARGESYKDKLYVGSVVMNRVNCPRFPDTIEKVIFQKNQFDGIRHKYFKFNPSDKYDKVCYKAAAQVLQHGPVIEALFFCNPKISSKRGLRWMMKRKLIKKSKNHWYFS